MTEDSHIELLMQASGYKPHGHVCASHLSLSALAPSLDSSLTCCSLATAASRAAAAACRWRSTCRANSAQQAGSSFVSNTIAAVLHHPAHTSSTRLLHVLAHLSLQRLLLLTACSFGLGQQLDTLLQVCQHALFLCAQDSMITGRATAFDRKHRHTTRLRHQHSNCNCSQPFKPHLC